MFIFETPESFCSQILNCGILELQFAIDLYNKNNIVFSFDELKGEFGEVNIDTIIYSGINKMAEKFITENENEIKKVLNVWDLDEYRSYNDLYEIYTNSLDSHLYFKDEKVQLLFEKLGYEI